MSNIKYFVRTMEGRNVDLPIDYEPIIDYEHKYVKSYINALYKINEYDAVLMEDDIVLCKNFKEELEKVVDEYPDTIINFFSAPRKILYNTLYQCIYI